MKETSPFQIIILVVFGLFILFAVAIFSSGGAGGNKDVFLGDVTVWGTLPSSIMKKNIEEIKLRDKTVNITYLEKKKGTFDSELIEALASGVGPDVILLPQDLILSHSNKIFKIPYESMTERDFKDRFIEEGELYLAETGIFALPLVVDPMIMYWNRDMFSSFGISTPPTSWEEFFTLAPKLTLINNSNSNISRSALAFGEFRNVTHAKDILSLLMLQAGNPIIIKKSTTKSGYSVVLNNGLNRNIPPADAALRFYTQFSNPSKKIYSWNRSLPSSRNMFIEGDLAVYFGFASEYSDLKRKNPHLNFDIAEVPQTKAPEGVNIKKTTYGKMQGFAILNATKNIPAAFGAIVLLSDKESAGVISKGLDLPSARRDLLTARPTGAYLPLFYSSALISRAWLDPAPKSTENLFMNMIERVVSGRSSVSESVSNANNVMEQLLK